MVYNQNFFVFYPILMKLGDVVVQMQEKQLMNKSENQIVE